MSATEARCEKAVNNLLERQTHPYLHQRMAAAYDAAKENLFPVDKNEQMFLQRQLIKLVGKHESSGGGDYTATLPNIRVTIGGAHFSIDSAQVPLIDDTTLRVALTANTDFKVAASGEWMVEVAVGKQSMSRVGKYDFQYASEVWRARNDGARMRFVSLRAPVVPPEQISKSSNSMGITELAMVAEMMDKNTSKVTLRAVQLVALLRPSEEMYSQEGSTMDTTAVSTGPMLPPYAAYLRPDESRKPQRDVTSKQTRLMFMKDDGTSVLVMPPTMPSKTTTGSELASQFVDAPGKIASMVVVGRDGQTVHSAGEDVGRLVRLGEASAPVSAIALRSWHAENNSDVDLDSSDSACVLLKRAGARQLADALQKCYAAIGSRTPSFNQLTEGSSGMPAFIPADKGVLKSIETALSTKTVKEEEEEVDGISADMNHLTTVLGTATTPLHRPGERATPSHMAFAIARSTVPGWETDGPERAVVGQLVELGVTSATFSVVDDKEEANNNKPLGAVYNIGEDENYNAELRSADQGITSLSSGLHATPEDIGRLFSDKNPWFAALPGSSTRSPVQPKHAHMMHALKPAHPLRENEAYSDHVGMVHTSVEYHNFPLRVATAIGCAQASHTVCVATVPRLHSTVVFTTNATPNEIARTYPHDSMTGFTKRLVNYAIDQVNNIGSAFVNDQAAAHLVNYAPVADDRIAALAKYEKEHVAHMFTMEQLEKHGLGDYINKEMISVMDSLASTNAKQLVPKACLVTKPARQVYGDKAKADHVALMLQLTHPGAGRTEQPIAYDQLVQSSLKSSRGALRAVNPATAEVGEFVSPVLLGTHLCLTHEGRLYAPHALIDQIRNGKAMRLFQEHKDVAAANTTEWDPYAPARGSDVTDVYDINPSRGAIGRRRGGGRRKGGGYRRRRRAGGFLGGLLGGAAASLLYPTLYRPPPYGYYPIPPGYYARGYWW